MQICRSASPSATHPATTSKMKRTNHEAQVGTVFGVVKAGHHLFVQAHAPVHRHILSDLVHGRRGRVSLIWSQSQLNEQTQQPRKREGAFLRQTQQVQIASAVIGSALISGHSSHTNRETCLLVCIQSKSHLVLLHRLVVVRLQLDEWAKHVLVLVCVVVAAQRGSAGVCG